MTTNADGSTSCDRCGADLGNGSLVECVVVSTLNDEQAVENLHLGLAHRCGCAGRVLTRAALAHYTAEVRDKGKPLALYRREADLAGTQDSTAGTASSPQDERTATPRKRAPRKRTAKGKA